MQKNKENLIDVLKSEFKKRNNPTDLKSSIIGKVVELTPLTVSISDGFILLTEGEELEISEWFRFRCNIDKTGALSSNVPENLTNAKGVKETHSQGGSPCKMPDAISYLATAIQSINTELLALKCVLAVGDFVAVSTLEENGKYILLDKVL